MANEEERQVAEDGSFQAHAMEDGSEREVAEDGSFQAHTIEDGSERELVDDDVEAHLLEEGAHAIEE